ncbi:MAG: hypothetical protein KDE55_16765 [Novosphingobium sp.]|nr:hypothetical protein [Novosphingobium sp.]
MIPSWADTDQGGNTAGQQRIRHAKSISYVAHMDSPGLERLELTSWRGTGDDREHVTQTVQLSFTQPHFGGKRWWMLCPFRGLRVGKLYLPAGGDRFASRQAWRLGYASQRMAERDRPFEALSRLQRKLGCTQGWEQPLFRPKGMHHRTFARHLERYWQLDRLCTAETKATLDRLRRVRTG